jgi:AcrR family transcriptional regulator
MHIAQKLCNVHSAFEEDGLAQEIREAILDATDTLLGRHGYHRITMEDIAQETGVGRRTVYLHFRSREDVCLACADRIFESLHGALQAIAAADDAPVERLRQMLLTRVLFMFDRAQDNYQKYLDLFAAVRPAYLARREQYVETEVALLQEVIAAGVRAGDFPSLDIPLTALALVQATNSLMPYTLSPRQLQAREEVKSQLERIIDLLLHGLCRSH